MQHRKFNTGREDEKKKDPTCPWCGALQSVARPSRNTGQVVVHYPGMVTVCLYCQGVSTYSKDLELVKMEASVLEEIARVSPAFIVKLEEMKAKARAIMLFRKQNNPDSN